MKDRMSVTKLKPGESNREKAGKRDAGIRNIWAREREVGTGGPTFHVDSDQMNRTVKI